MVVPRPLTDQFDQDALIGGRWDRIDPQHLRNGNEERELSPQRDRRLSSRVPSQSCHRPLCESSIDQNSRSFSYRLSFFLETFATISSLLSFGRSFEAQGNFGMTFC